MAKSYVVMKENEQIASYKRLDAAKKLAEAEGGEVFCDGESVYKTATSAVDTTSPAVDETQGADEDTPPALYQLTSLMNVRAAPSMDSRILETRAAGALVVVSKIKDDWMHLEDGAFILYGSGQYAVKSSATL